MGADANKNFVIFRCPSESAGFGKYTEGLFSYTHYAINTRVCGYDQIGTYEKEYNLKRHKETMVTNPSKALVFVDSGRKSDCSSDFANPAYQACRHSANKGVIRDDTQFKTYIGTVTNGVFYSGNARAIRQSEITGNDWLSNGVK